MPTNVNNTLFTIGHSVHTIDYFISLLRQHEIAAIADVRSSPFSRFSPAFNRDNLAMHLKAHGIHYVFLGDELGARRTEKSCYRDNKVVYSLVAQTASFASGIDRLRRGVELMRIALMCAERDPLTCHRAVLVTHYSRNNFPDVKHILANGNIESGEEADERLLREYGVRPDDLFNSKLEQIEHAYTRRAEEIAFTELAST